MEGNGRNNQNRFVRRLPGRLRIYIDGLQGKEALAKLFERFCGQIPGVTHATAGVATGRALLLFDETVINHSQLEDRLLHLESLLTGEPRIVSGETVSGQTQTVSDRLAAAAKEQPLTEGSPATGADWHSLQPGEILHHLQSDGQSGLSMGEAENRRLYFGKNRIPEAETSIWYKTLLRQFFNFTTLTMIGISALPAFFGRLRDTAGVLFILGVNAIIGTYQEQKAQRDILSLKKLAVHKAKAIRAGRETEVAADELVPGDILLLEAGDRIPADAILLESWNVEIDESPLTGESVPVAKSAAVVCGSDTPLAERKNTVFMGTFMTRGRAKAVVVATGGKTEMGNLAAVLQKIENRPTPLQQRLTVVARTLVISALAIAGLVVATRFLQGFTLTETLMTGVSVATTAISEGLPIMITVALVAGMRRMARHKAVVRRLSALETLAKVNVICSDKTGTLTKNEMTVRTAVSGDRVWTFTGGGYRPDGKLFENERPAAADSNADLAWIATVASVCNDAVVMETAGPRQAGQNGQGFHRPLQIQGDPTEAALLVAAMKAGVSPEICRSRWQRLSELPFDSDRRRMTVVCKNREGEIFVFTKGAVDVVLERCNYTKNAGRVLPLNSRSRRKIIGQERHAARLAMRVLAVAYKQLHGEPHSLSPDELETDLIFGGMFAMMDPPREDVRDSIVACRNSGIEVVMITGDHPQTAEAIGRELGIVTDGGQVLTGGDLAGMSDEELMAATKSAKIFSRVSPVDKQRIVSAFQKRGLIVAMTGDGVNDAPALKQADVGIAVGSGTDVAKESSSLVLMDNHFSAIVKAIRQGRSVLENIRGTIGYIFTGNLAEVLYSALVVAAGLPLPLMPLQMMFMNMLTDSLPTMVMTLGKPAARADEGIEQSLPEAKDVFDKDLIARVIAGGLLTGLGATALFMGVTALTGNPLLAGTVALVTLCIGKLAQVPVWRHANGDSGGWRNDPIMTVTLGISLAGLVAAIYLPQLRFLFNSVPLGLDHWALILATLYTARRLADPLAAAILSALKRPAGAKPGIFQIGAQPPAG